MNSLMFITIVSLSIIIYAIYYVRRIIKKSEAILAKPVHHWKSLNDFDFDVVGESYYQRNILGLIPPHGDQSLSFQTVAHLVPERNNKHDKNAVRVDINGKQVGHLSREDAERFRGRLRAKGFSTYVTSCDALIVGGHLDKSGKRMSYGVRLDIKRFD